MSLNKSKISSVTFVINSAMCGMSGYFWKKDEVWSLPPFPYTTQTYLQVFNIRAPYVREKPISLNQTRVVHV